MKSLALLAAAVVAFCPVAAGLAETTPAAGVEPRFALPAAYEGVLPCADCAGMKYTLDLFEDGVFYLRVVYLGKGPGEGASVDDIGRFTLTENGSRVSLKGGRETAERFSVKAGALRKLDAQGKEIPSELNIELKRAETFVPIEPRLPLKGMYTFREGTGSFTECRTGRTFPLARGSDTSALDAAYGRERSRTGEPLLVEMQGRLVLQPAGESEPPRSAVVIERFGRARPGETCTGGKPLPAIENVVWGLTEVDGQPAVAGKKGRSPQIRLSAQGHRVSGSGGCSRLTGIYALSGTELSFSKVAGSMAACPAGMDQDARLIAALEKTSTFKVEGDALQLLDGRGNVLARFVRSGTED